MSHKQNMEIPSWMDAILGPLTGGTYTSSTKLMEDFDTLSDTEPELVAMMDVIISTAKRFDEIGLIKRPIKKHITEVRLGEIFKIYPDQERYFTLQSSKIEEGMITVREFSGGKGYNMGSTWLGEPDSCHADIEVIVVPELPVVYH